MTIRRAAKRGYGTTASSLFRHTEEKKIKLTSNFQSILQPQKDWNFIENQFQLNSIQLKINNRKFPIASNSGLESNRKFYTGFYWIYSEFNRNELEK